jgi:hypothetical protein
VVEVVSSPVMLRAFRCTLIGLFVAAGSLLATDITGIWTGEQQGRRGQPEEIAFQFKVQGSSVTGKLFGDEFDLAVTDATLSGDQIRFTVTTVNYYSGGKTKFIYSGTIKGSEMELTRERVPSPTDPPTDRPQMKQTLKLKRLT